jgi:hypothetical protein
MVLIERIGPLILITLEGAVDDDEFQSITLQLKELSEKEDEVVVSLNHSTGEGDSPREKDPATEKRYNEIIDYCLKTGIRMYSYIYE